MHTYVHCTGTGHQGHWQWHVHASGPAGRGTLLSQLAAGRNVSIGINAIIEPQISPMAWPEVVAHQT